MVGDFNFFVTFWIKFFFLFTPFFALSMFLSMTRGMEELRRRRLAMQITGAVGAMCLALFFFGNQVFALLGITLDAFRVGAGTLLLLSAIGLAQAKNEPDTNNPNEDIVVVPLAMPIIVGPATTGTLLVLGVEITNPARKGIECLALIAAVLSVGFVLLIGSMIERVIGKKGINILTKITGLVLAALAADVILTGVRNILSIR